MNKLTLKDFARLFGTTVKDIPEDCRALISKTNFSYRKLGQKERDQVMLGVLKKIESGNFSIAGKKKRRLWEKGWGDILKNFIKSGYDIKELAPHYDARPARYARLDRDYIAPKDPMFEMKWLKIFRIWLFRKYFKKFDNIYEFGCGTGQNLAVLARLFPEKKLIGTEWVEPSVKIIKLLAKKYNYNMDGQLFDMFSPAKNFKILPNSAVLTRAALEQIGPDFDKFLNFLLKQSPALCVHTEPTVELYDENNLVDYLAIKFQRRRNYLDGFLNRLKELEKEGKIEIIKIHRITIGSLPLDPYSYVVWRPKANKK